MLTKLKNLFCRPIPLPCRIDKIFHVRVPRFLSVILIILFGLPIILTLGGLVLVVAPLSLYLFFLDHLGYGYTVDWVGFSLVLGVTLLILLIHHFFSKTKSIASLLRWAIALVFIEVIAYIWLNAWNWEYYITDLSLDDSVVGYALPIEDRLEIIMTYTKALFQTVALGLMLIVGRIFIKQK